MDFHKNSKGFTIVEMMIVLMVVTFMSSIIWYNGANIHKRKVIDQFFRQLETDILYVQQYAMVHQEQILIYWYPDQSYYEAERYAFKGELFERKYGKHIQVKATTLRFPIIFMPNGSINRGGSIFIYIDDETYKVIFTIGKGRFRVEKL
jgi:competence protein ComGD